MANWQFDKDCGNVYILTTVKLFMKISHGNTRQIKRFSWLLGTTTEANNSKKHDFWYLCKVGMHKLFFVSGKCFSLHFPRACDVRNTWKVTYYHTKTPKRRCKGIYTHYNILTNYNFINYTLILKAAWLRAWLTDQTRDRRLFRRSWCL